MKTPVLLDPVPGFLFSSMSDTTPATFTPEQQALMDKFRSLFAATPAAPVPQELQDWRELTEAVLQLGLPADRRTRKLWPNNWHQDCAFIAFKLHNAHVEETALLT